MSDPLDPSDQDASAQAQEAALLGHPAQFEALDTITLLLDAVRRSYSPAQYRAVQQRLGASIEQVDAAALAAKMDRQQAQDRVRRLAKRRIAPDDAVLAALEQTQREAEQRRLLFQRLGRQYRAVGDAIAWQLYNFRSVAVLALGMNRSPGPLGGKEGSIAEAEAVEACWEQEQAFALRHDYTNILRVADLSIFSLDKPLCIKEVKTSSDQQVGRKQKQRAARVAALTVDHITIGLDGQLFIHKAYDPVPPDGAVSTNLSLFSDAIMRAEEEGIGEATNSYLAVTAVNLLHPRLRPPDDAMQERIRRMREVIPAAISAPACIAWLVADSLMKSPTKGYGAPYTIYPFSPRHCAMLVTGYLRLQIILNTAALTEAFRRAGFEATCLLSPGGGQSETRDANDPYYILRKAGRQLTISPLPIEQVLFEGLTIESLVAAVLQSEQDPVPRTPSGILLPVKSLKVFNTSEVMEALWRSSREYRQD